MTYAAIFGRNPALSAAELAALADRQGFRVNPLGKQAVELVDFPLALADKLGATTKLVELLDDVFPRPEHAVAQLVGTAPSGGKFIFGISLYGGGSSGTYTKLARQYLDKRGVKSRYVQAKGALSAVQVHHNKMLEKGADWCLLQMPRGWRAGRTVWVYDFAGFNKRDYKKPVADAKRGMLPPHLARAMVNIAARGEETLVVDPFCGVGGLLLEGVAAGYHVFGSDNDADATKGAVANLRWLAPGGKTWQVETLDATEPLPVGDTSVIATEGYLGRPVRQGDSAAALEEQAQAVAELVDRFLSVADAFRVVMTLPAWRLPHGKLRRLPLVDRVGDYGYTKVRPLPTGMTFPGLTERETIDVSRPKQRVVHELLILEKK